MCRAAFVILRAKRYHREAEWVDATDSAPRSPFGRLSLEDLEALSGKAQGLIEAARDAAVEPHRRKILRRFGATEILQYLGNISIDTLYRRLKKDEQLPQGTQVSARRREFSPRGDSSAAERLRYHTAPPKRRAADGPLDLQL